MHQEIFQHSDLLTHSGDLEAQLHSVIIAEVQSNMGETQGTTGS